MQYIIFTSNSDGRVALILSLADMVYMLADGSADADGLHVDVSRRQIDAIANYLSAHGIDEVVDVRR